MTATPEQIAEFEALTQPADAPSGFYPTDVPTHIISADANWKCQVTNDGRLAMSHLGQFDHYV